MLISDILYREQNIITKLSFVTEFSYINIVCGLTKADLYKDYSLGLHMNFNELSFVFSGLNHNNSTLGNPRSIELIKKF